MCRHSGWNQKIKVIQHGVQKTEIVIVGDRGLVCDNEECHLNDEFVSGLL